MTVPTTIADLSTTAADNAPQGHDSPDTLDNIQRAHGAFIKQLSTGTGFAAGNLAGITPGTGIATALAINAGSTGAVQLNNGSGAGLTSVNAATLGGKTFADPGAIGGGTAAAGSFTTLSATSTASLVTTNIIGTATIGGNSATPTLYLGGTAPDADRAVNVYFQSSNVQKNWRMSHVAYVADSLEFTPSTAGGGSTYTTPTLVLSPAAVAVTGTLSATGTAIDFVTSGTVLTVGVGANNGTVSAGVFTDRTKAYTGDALAEIAAITHIDGEIDHATLPAFAQVELVKPIFEAQEVLKPIYEAKETIATKEVDGTLVQVIETSQVQVGEETVIEQVKVGEYTATERDIGAMISMLTVAVQQLTTRLEKLELTK